MDLVVSTKWLDICSLCRAYLPWVGNAQLQEIYYFSAYAYHLGDPGIIGRHRTFIKALESTGIKCQMGEFKEKEVKCPRFDKRRANCVNCNGLILRHEEKETDVAIAVKLLEILSTDLCDTAVLVTGDTDLAPAIETAKRLFQNKSVRMLFPYKRKNKELSRLVASTTIIPSQYQRYQFPDPVQGLDGKLIHKPISW
jgi:uncharacterized LabA/DUF88 family protein